MLGALYYKEQKHVALAEIARVSPVHLGQGGEALAQGPARVL